MKSKKDDFKSELETQYSILIQTEKKEQRKRTLIIIIILLLTFISTIITNIYSYKYYKELKQEDIMKDKTTKYYQTLETVYETSKELNFTVINGFNLPTPYVFTVTNTGDKEITYNINISSVKTNLVLNENLKYTITSEDIKLTNPLPLNNQTLLENITIEPNQSKHYELQVSFNGSIDGAADYKSIINIEQQKSI